MPLVALSASLSACNVRDPLAASTLVDATDDARPEDTTEDDSCEAESDELLCLVHDRTCGLISQVLDSCGVLRDADCDGCPPGQLCVPGASACQTCDQMDFCMRAGAQCGVLSQHDHATMARCGFDQLDCGECAVAGLECEDNQCVCPTPTCAANQCDVIANTCGSEVDCGGCADPADLCVDNTCVCVPESQTQLCATRPTVECGVVTDLQDRCGQTLPISCGSCEPSDQCINNLCVCDPGDLSALKSQACGSRICGEVQAVDDACGEVQTFTCGTCPVPDLCLNDGTQCTIVIKGGGDNYGHAVAINDGDVVVGQPTFQTDSGKLYGYRAQDEWNAQTLLSPFTTDTSFGQSVDLVGDDVVVGGKNEAYVLDWQTNAFALLTRQTSSTSFEHAGVRVGIDAISATLNSATFGVPGFDDILDSNVGGYGTLTQGMMGWSFAGYEALTSLGAPFDQLESWAGSGVSMAPSRRAIAVPKHDSVVIQAYELGAWVHKSVITLPSPVSFGVRVDFSPTGKHLAITQGAATTTLSALPTALPNRVNHTVHIYEDTSTDASTWVAREVFPAPSGASQFGYAIAMGDQDLFVSDPATGDLYRFTRSGQVWTQVSIFNKYGSMFGASMDFDNTYLVVSKPASSGTIFIMKYR